MLTDDQIINELRQALAADTDGLNPRPGLLDHIHQDLPDGRRSRRLRWRPLRVDAIVSMIAVGSALAVALVALVILHHTPRTRPAPPASQLPVGTGLLAVRAPDPSGGRQWGLRIVQTRRLRACLQIGRVQSGKIGSIEQDGVSGSGGRFHPIPLHSNFPCAQTDADGHLFRDVFEQEVPASASFDSAAFDSPARDLRNIAYGTLGPDAVSITYQSGQRRVTERTGFDGAYIAVVAATKHFCTRLPDGPTHCQDSSGEMTTSTLQSGVITAVRYRDGRVCHLPTPTAAATETTVSGASCPNVGYTKYPPRHVPHVTEAQVKAPMTVRILKAKHYCYKIHVKFGSFQIPCDHGIPHGYHVENSTEAPHIALVDISFTARLAANNHQSVYEFSYGRATGPKNCTLNTGSTDATTMVPVRAGQRVTIQDSQELCPGGYTGLVTYQPNGAPGRDTLDRASPIHDHSILVARFKYTLRK